MSAGFDAHERDPLGVCGHDGRLRGHRDPLHDAASDSATGRLRLVIEGGYHLRGAVATAWRRDPRAKLERNIPSMSDYRPQDIEQKWQRRWTEITRLRGQ